MYPLDPSVTSDHRNSYASSTWPKSASASPPQQVTVIASKRCSSARQRQSIHHATTSGLPSGLSDSRATGRFPVPSHSILFSLLTCGLSSDLNSTPSAEAGVRVDTKGRGGALKWPEGCTGLHPSGHIRSCASKRVSGTTD